MFLESVPKPPGGVTYILHITNGACDNIHHVPGIAVVERGQPILLPIWKGSNYISFGNVFTAGTSCHSTNIVAFEVQPRGGCNFSGSKETGWQKISQSGARLETKFNDIFQKVITNAIFGQDRQMSTHNLPDVIEPFTERLSHKPAWKRSNFDANKNSKQALIHLELDLGLLDCWSNVGLEFLTICLLPYFVRQNSSRHLFLQCCCKCKHCRNHTLITDLSPHWIAWITDFVQSWSKRLLYLVIAVMTSHSNHKCILCIVYI